MYEDCVLDLETTDSGSNSNILSIGAVLMNKSEKKLGPTFYRVIDQTLDLNLGFTTSETTMNWWSEQSEEARKVFTDPGIPLGIALDDFTMFLEMNTEDVKVWGNGSDFDNVILKNAYRATGRDIPWSYRNNRCLRTHKATAIITVKEGPFVGVRHNALDDAIHEAKHIKALYEGTIRVLNLIGEGIKNV